MEIWRNMEEELVRKIVFLRKQIRRDLRNVEKLRLRQRALHQCRRDYLQLIARSPSSPSPKP